MWSCGNEGKANVDWFCFKQSKYGIMALPLTCVRKRRGGSSASRTLASLLTALASVPCTRPRVKTWRDGLSPWMTALRSCPNRHQCIPVCLSGLRQSPFPVLHVDTHTPIATVALFSMPRVLVSLIQ